MPLEPPPPVQPPLEPPARGLRRSSQAPWIVLGVLVVVVVAALALWRSRRAPPPAPTPVAQTEPTPVPEAPAPSAPAPATPPRPEDVSAHPLYRRGIAEQGLERRWAVVTDNLAEGVSPRKQLDFLAPSKPFSVTARGGHTVIAPESYQRYDAFADAVGSIDVPTLLAVYRMMHMGLETAYRALGYPDASLDAVSVRALRRIVAAPVPHGDVAVESGAGGMYPFVDPKLEELGAVEKHLIRMGPRNQRLVQGKAREILQQMGPVRVQPAQQRK